MAMRHEGFRQHLPAPANRPQVKVCPRFRVCYLVVGRWVLTPSSGFLTEAALAGQLVGPVLLGRFARWY